MITDGVASFMQPHESPRPTKGGTVIIVGNGPSRGLIGKIIEDDQSDLPYCIRFADGHEAWYKESMVALAEVEEEVEEFTVEAEAEVGVQVEEADGFSLRDRFLSIIGISS